MAEINKNNASMEFPLQIARQYGAPLDKHSVFYAKAEAETYAASSPLAYAGQIVTVVDEGAETVDAYKITPDGQLSSMRISPGTSTPLMDGTASVGTATEYARANHRHPSDSRKSAVKANGTIKSSVNFQLVGTQLTITVE